MYLRIKYMMDYLKVFRTNVSKYNGFKIQILTEFIIH